MPKLDSEESLVEFLTTVLWTASAQHSAVNFGQFDYYSFVPNRPFTMRLGMPEDLSKVTYDYILKALPSEDQAVQSISTAKVLSLNIDAELDPTLSGIKVFILFFLVYFINIFFL